MNRTTSRQYHYQSRFRLVKSTPQGGRLICTGLTFAQAAALATEIPASIVKFERMEVTHVF
jgi:hypothetical protein